MPKIVLALDEEVSTFEPTKLEREKLYGKKSRLVVDAEGRACETAWLLADGSAVVGTGGTAHVYVDDGWTAFEPEERVQVGLDGAPVTKLASTLGVAQRLTRVAPATVLEITATTIYLLDGEELGPNLAGALRDGAIFEAPFLYRDGVEYERAFLLQNDQSIFAIIGRDHGFPMLEREALPIDVADGDEDADDLDFSMM